MKIPIQNSTFNCQGCPKLAARKSRKKHDPLYYLFCNKPPTDLIPVELMEKLVNRRKQTLLKWANEGLFPSPIRQQKRVLGWRRNEYEQWIININKRQ